MIFKRKIYDKIKKWKQDDADRNALLIEGARRIGKSTIVKQFAENEYESYIIIDFSNVSPEINSLFKNMSDLDYFFLQLQLLTNSNLIENKSLIVFDEVQMQPLARQAIKHLVNDGRYHYIETGSLISIKKNVKDILIPSEELRITMHPMDYEEFRWALGDTTSTILIQKAFEQKLPLGEAVNRKLMRDFRLYMLIGGMPQAVSEYINTNDFSRVDLVKRAILELYIDDLRKVDPTGRASSFFKYIPAQLSSNASRYQLSKVKENSRIDRDRIIIANMVDSMTVTISYHVNDPSIGMALSQDMDKFKLFLVDTGLFVTLAFMDKDFTENIIYKKFLSNKLSANLGYVYENAVAQMLKSAGNELYYHTMRSKTSNHNYEIDFLLARKNKICPIEVKSSSYKRHTSLDKFIEKYSARIGDKYLIYTKDMQRNKDITMVPIYMTSFL